MATIKSLQTTTVIDQKLGPQTTLQDTFYNSTKTIGEFTVAEILKIDLFELAQFNSNLASETWTGNYQTSYNSNGDFVIATNSFTAFFTGDISPNGSTITKVVIQRYPDPTVGLLAGYGTMKYEGLPFISSATLLDITKIENIYSLNDKTTMSRLITDLTISNDATLTGTISSTTAEVVDHSNGTWYSSVLEGIANVSVNIINPNLVTVGSGFLSNISYFILDSTGKSVTDLIETKDALNLSLNIPIKDLDLNSGNDTFQLTGSVGSSFNGGTGNDSFYISLPDNDIDGGDGIDTAVIGNSPDRFKFSKDGTKLIITSNIDGTKNSISDIERIQFSDKAYALDINGNAGAAAKAIIATFGAESLNAYMVPALSVVDGGMSLVQVCDLVVNNQLIESVIGSNSNGAFVDHVYENVVGVAPSQEDHDTFTALLDDGTYTKSSLLSLAATLTESLVTANSVDLIGVLGSADGELLAIQYDLGLG